MIKHLLILLSVISTLFFSCTQEVQDETYDIAIFVPGAVDGSPTFEMMVEGVQSAAEDEADVQVSVIEGGYNQSSWESQVAVLASEGEYDLIVTSNPAMPEICNRVSQTFPDQQFLSLEAYYQGNEKIATFLYNHRELAYLHGVLAALLSKEANPEAPVIAGLLAGQEYPAMNEAILPGFEQGVQAIDPQGTVEFRVLGNWYDASKATEIAQNLFSSGVEVILPIAGTANQGVLTSAKENGKSVLWYDSSGYDLEEGVVKGSGLINQLRAAQELVEVFIAGETPDPLNGEGGYDQGYVDYLTWHPMFQSLPQNIQESFSAQAALVKTGSVDLPMPR